MDLIDREQLMNYIRSKKINIGKLAHDVIMKQESVNAVSEEVYTEEFNLRKDAELKVYKLERALEQEPKTGHWINAKVGKMFPSNDYKCSECGNILDFDGVNCGRGDANFCPNCGAKMESEHQE